MTVRYVTLSDVFPNVSRATLYRWRQKRKLPPPDRVINNREYYLESRFAASDEAEIDAARKAETDAA